MSFLDSLPDPSELFEVERSLLVEKDNVVIYDAKYIKRDGKLGVNSDVETFYNGMKVTWLNVGLFDKDENQYRGD